MSRKGGVRKITDEQKTTGEQSQSPCEGTPCAEMMEKIMGQEGKGCGCMEMMEKMMGQEGKEGFDGMMSQMMTACCGEQGETEEKADTEAA